MAMKKARPTEYKGIRFRSKSEAMFARYLELYGRESAAEIDRERFDDDSDMDVTEFGCGVCGFTYEPKGFEVEDWCPDFLLWQVMGGISIPSFRYELIEYKPSEPTATYVEESLQRFTEIFKRFENMGWHDFSRLCDFRLYYGSVYTTVRGAFSLVPESNRIVHQENDDWLGPFEKAVRETRFDLASQTD